MLPSTSSTKGSDKKDIIQHTMTLYLQAHRTTPPRLRMVKGSRCGCVYPLSKPFSANITTTLGPSPSTPQSNPPVIIRLCAQHGCF